MSLWSSSCNLDGSKNDSLCTGFQQSLDPLNNLQDPIKRKEEKIVINICFGVSLISFCFPAESECRNISLLVFFNFM